MRGLRMSWLMVGIVLPVSVRFPIAARRAWFQRAKRKSALHSRCVRRSPVSQRTAPRERETVMHLLVW